MAIVLAAVAAAIVATLLAPGVMRDWVTWAIVIVGAVLIAVAYLYLVPLVGRERHV